MPISGLNTSYPNICKSFQGEGPYAGQRIVVLRFNTCNLKCLVGSTMIAAEHGQKRLRDIKVGELVWALDNGEMKLKKVLHIMSREVSRSEIMKVVLDTQNRGIDKIFATTEHPFFVNGKWIEANELKAGDEIYHLPEQFYLHQRMRGSANPMKNEVSKLKMFTHSKPLSISSIELRVARIAREAKLPVIHTNGSRKYRVRGSNGMYAFPDFVVDGQKKVIEVFDAGYPWRESDWMQKKKKLYDSVGVKCLFLDAANECSDRTIAGELGAFVANGIKVVSVERGITEHQASRMGTGWRGRGGSKQSVMVYNLEVEGETYFANEVMVHNCHWNTADGDMAWCDTKTTWDGTNDGQAWDIVDLVNTIGKVAKEKLQPAKWEASGWKSMRKEARIVMITGGEPMLRQNNSEFQELVKGIQRQGMFVHIETNGTLPPNEWARKNIYFFVVSPKYQLYKKAYDEAKIKEWLSLPPSQMAWKFVVGNMNDVSLLRQWMYEVRIPKDADIWLMGLTNDKKDGSLSEAILEAGVVEAFKILEYKSVRISPRLQIGIGKDLFP